MGIFFLQAIELMVVDALLKANDYLNISSFIQDPSKYWKVSRAAYLNFGVMIILCLYHELLCYLSSFVMQLDDTIMKTIETASNPELKESRDLIMRIRRRNLYQVVKLANNSFHTLN